MSREQWIPIAAFVAGLLIGALLLWRWPEIAGAQSASLTGGWQPTGYLITWQAAAPACLTVQQSGGLETLAGDCAASGEVLLIRGGSYAIAAIPGAVVRLRAADGLGLLGEVTIPPEYAAWLPLVAGP